MNWFDRLGIVLAYVLIVLAALVAAFAIWQVWEHSADDSAVALLVMIAEGKP